MSDHRVPPRPERRPNVELRVALVRDGRKLYEVAAAAQVAPSIISAAASGRELPSATARARIAAALGAPEADLFPDETERART